MTAQKVTAEEIPLVKTFLKLVWQDTYGSIYPAGAIDRITSVWHDPERLKEQILDPDGYFAVTKDENSNMVGLVTVRRIEPKKLFMSRLYVRPDKQRQGIGTYLLSESTTHFPGAQSVDLEVEEHNAKGTAFYTKQGFKKVGKKQIQFEEWSIPVFVMEKTL